VLKRAKQDEEANALELLDRLDAVCNNKETSEQEKQMAQEKMVPNQSWYQLLAKNLKAQKYREAQARENRAQEFELKAIDSYIADRVRIEKAAADELKQ
jgi:hypothetical protein